jgi:hypothetical protein
LKILTFHYKNKSTTGNNNMSDYDNQIGLWKRQPKDSDVAGKPYPHYTGKAQIAGESKQAAAWLNTNKTNDKQPDISIKLSDPITKEDAPF